VDYRRYYGAGRFYYRITPKSDGFAQAGAGRDDLDTGASRRGDADFYDLSLGVRGKQSVKTSMSGRIGYRWRRPIEDGFRDVNHYIAALRGETTPLGLSTFSAEWSADIRPAISQAGYSAVDQRLTAGVSRRIISERLRGQASLFYGMVDYYGAEGRPADVREEDVPRVFDGREDDYWGYSLGLDAWMRRHFSMGISYAYFENRGGRGGSAEDRGRASYGTERWGLRASWNY